MTSSSVADIGFVSFRSLNMGVLIDLTVLCFNTIDRA